MKCIHVVGARPQFIKLSPFILAMDAVNIDQKVVHTGQHFDDNMSQIFFSELEMKKPDFNLGVNNLSHGAMTGRMLEEIEKVLLIEQPDIVLVYGDTNSTLAGALAGSKLNLKIAHVEAGLRSFNRKMPEEQNRIITDHISEILLVPTQVGLENLAKEGLLERAHLVGDVMFDAVRFYSRRADDKGLLFSQGLSAGKYFLSTIHRASVTNNANILKQLFYNLENISREILPVLMPLHPRTKEMMINFGIDFGAIRVVSPVSYLQMLALLRDSKAVITDSGGLQKEAYFLEKFCFTVRDETEWVETVECGANLLCGEEAEKLLRDTGHVDSLYKNAEFGKDFYGDGNAAVKSVDLLIK